MLSAHDEMGEARVKFEADESGWRKIGRIRGVGGLAVHVFMAE
jgi:hypothetical protein